MPPSHHKYRKMAHDSAGYRQISPQPRKDEKVEGVPTPICDGRKSARLVGHMPPPLRQKTRCSANPGN